MPRPANSCLLNLFQYNASNQIICNNGSCKGRMLFRHSTNLQRHLKVMHPSLFVSYLETRKAFENKKEIQVQKRLIELVRDRPILWNDSVSDTAYQEWEEISRELNIEVDSCKQKWNLLKTRFNKEFLKKQRFQRETDRRLPCRQRLFACLEFLRDEGNPEEKSEHNKPTEMDFTNSHSKEDSCTLFYKDDDVLADGRNNKIIYENESTKRTAENDEDDDHCIVKKPMETQFKTQFLENDAENNFLLSLVPYLKAIPESRRLLARQRIQSILLEEEQRQLYHPIKIESEYSQNDQDSMSS